MAPLAPRHKNIPLEIQSSWYYKKCRRPHKSDKYQPSHPPLLIDYFSFLVCVKWNSLIFEKRRSRWICKSSTHKLKIPINFHYRHNCWLRQTVCVCNSLTTQVFLKTRVCVIPHYLSKMYISTDSMSS